MRECFISILCVSHAILIIDINGEKKKERETKTRMLFPIIIPSSYNALIPAQYALVYVVMCVAHDNDAMMVSLLRGCMVLDRYTLCIEEYIPNRL